ncbi:hypothetical protein TNCV_3075441 [Trichonephila clavipes]|nr:hypothetical protein TNCV_3075441 [Trichonephila clavipes]
MLEISTHPALLSKWKRLPPEAASGTNGAFRKLPDDWAYHHHLSAIFFVESAVPSNCNRAMNFLPADTAQREALSKWAFSKMEQIPPGFLTSCGQMKLILASW